MAYNYTHHGRRKHTCWYHVERDDIVFQQLLGDYDDVQPSSPFIAVETESLPAFKTTLMNPTALSEAAIQLDHLVVDDGGGDETTMTTTATTTPTPLPLVTPSVRQLATVLPFAMRFQLERLVFEKEHVPVQVVKKPAAASQSQAALRRAAEIKLNTRKLLLAMQGILLPILLEQHYQHNDDGMPAEYRECSEEDAPNVFAELWANQVWGTFVDVAKAIVKGTVLDFVQPQLSQALQRTKEIYKSALDNNNNNMINNGIDDVYPSYRIPMAEYHAQFCPYTAQLRPTLLEILPRRNRRAYREIPQVHDRFMLISSVDFDPTIVAWCEQQPRLANRSYHYLLDKGAGKPTVWMYAPPPCTTRASHWTRDALLLHFGDFTKVPATKLGDRLALSFTQTEPIVRLGLDQIVPIPEIVRNGYTFSDGVGVMGHGIAEQIQRVMGLKKLPGAVQIRMGGVKGMFSIHDKFPANKVGVRPSMVKFPSNHTVLEVKHVAEANTSPENKLFAQCILNLSHLMNPENRKRVFSELQTKAVAEMAYEFDTDGQEQLLAGDMTEIMRYTFRVINKANKYNGQRFTPQEYQGIKKRMIAAKAKVNLRCAVTLMQGVLDEHGILNPGEVLVGNGLVEGPVWICRSPCTAPGEIQRAYAIPRSPGVPYSYLEDVLVFSARGNRPLADMLAGGDLDGDEFYVITDKRLVGMFDSTESKDYGSQKGNPTLRIDVSETFTMGASARMPSMVEQIQVFRQYMSRGNMVSQSAEAWIRAADKEGPDSHDARVLADLSQQALDARKLANDFDEEKIEVMRKVLRTCQTPSWYSGGKPTNIGNGQVSILGFLYHKWHRMIETMTKTEGRVFKREISTLDDEESQYLETQSVGTTVASSGNVCVVCLAVADMRCPECNEWYCSVSCAEYHGEETGHRSSIAVHIPSRIGTEITVAPQNDDTTTARNLLLEIVFDRRQPDPLPATSICFNSLSQTDLASLASMVQLEFYTDLRNAAMEDDGTREKITPHVDDIFLAKCSYKQGGEKLICRRRDGDLFLVNKDDQEVEWGQAHKRISSISGSARILENLLRQPRTGSLMHSAMRREALVTVVEKDNGVSHPIIDTLNASQKRVIFTVTDESFKRGFLAVHSPPGSGKTKTATAITITMGRGVIVTAPSNAAVANVALRIFRSGYFRRDEVVVWGDGCDESVRFLNPRHRYDRFQAFQQACNKCDDEKKTNKWREDIASWLQLCKEATIEEINETCKFSADPFASARVLLCTLNTAGSPTLRKSVQDRFDLLILDEAGQCPEAEFYISTTFPGVRRVVLLGDPKQLPATVKNKECKKAGYGESFLSHVLEFYPEKVHFLDLQYRSDPRILDLYNNLFYDGGIRSHDIVRGRKPDIEYPLKFFDTLDLGKEAILGHSWANEYELTPIENILQNDPDIQKILVESSIEPRIIVISPYNAQVDRLKQQLSKMKSYRLEIGTVDGFQGQEADVVILSTVRTRAVGFVDDARRINVGISRARRILRIVGDLAFFKSIDDEDSTLCRLAKYLQSKKDLVEVIPVNEWAWKSPDWTLVTKWRATMTSRFHNCLKNMGRMHRNLAYTTLLALSQPSCSDIETLPEESRRWHITCLQKGNLVQIVWIAKEFEWNGGPQIHYVGTIEAHFAGSRSECLRFTQNHHQVPSDALAVKRDLSGIIRSEVATIEPIVQIDHSWVVTNEIQQVVLDDELEELPEGIFALDHQQEGVIATLPPLLLESRSGTGKTNVLFQHAVAHAKRLMSEQNPKPICFVTVSSKLRSELDRRFREVQQLYAATLPQISFFCFRDILDRLLKTRRIKTFDNLSICKFLEYTETKKSHAKLQVEANLIENEIGGVILGSLQSAEQQQGLLRDQYLKEIRSNVPNDTDVGRAKRSLIYDEYEQYAKWKQEGARYDLQDVVLELFKRGIPDELFQSLYLDEVQDFSYSSIFLLCSVAGKTDKFWVAAGDTAQMISPGCSFTFAGMKQVLRAIDESTALRKVVKLQRNYRMTKGVLEVGNAILRHLRECFPYAIENLTPEIAMKDLGLRVVVCDWEHAMKENASFGVDQAVILSSPKKEEELASKIGSWLDGHPFILSVLESKGLEFDDVVVAFDVERSAWLVEKKQVASLQLLRQLYVAVTRAKRRVVVLTKKNNPAMNEFFTNLGAGIEKAESSIISLEFDKQTSAEEWFNKAMSLFDEEKYALAESCFVSAQKFGWANRASGCKYREMGRKNQAKENFGKAAQLFFENSQFEQCLDVLLDFISLPGRDPNLDTILNEALERRLDHLPAKDRIRFALHLGSFDTVQVSDLANTSLASIFQEYRHDKGLKRIVDLCSDEERKKVQVSLPAIVGDYYFARRTNLIDCTSLYITAGDLGMASKATTIEIDRAKASEDYGNWTRLATLWLNNAVAKSSAKTQSQIVSRIVQLFVKLFEDPNMLAAKSAKECMRSLGKGAIRAAVMNRSLGIEGLQRFDPQVFEKEIRDELVSQYRNEPIKVVLWYMDRSDRARAQSFAESRLGDFADEEFKTTVLHLLNRSDLINEVERRKLFVPAISSLLGEENFDLRSAEEISNRWLQKLEPENVDSLLAAWKSRFNDERVKRFLLNTKSRQQTNIVLMFGLFHNPEMAGKRDGKRYTSLFGEELVRKAVDKGGPYASSRHSVLSSFGVDTPISGTQSSEFERGSGGGSPESQKFSNGDLVRIVGLQNQNSLNGTRGLVVGPVDTKAGEPIRYAVQTEGKRLSIKPVNLELLAVGGWTNSVEEEENEAEAAAELSSDDETGNDSDDSSSVPPLLEHGASSSESGGASIASESDGSLPSLASPGRLGESSSDESI